MATYKTSFLVFIIGLLTSCSYIDYISNNSIEISISSDNFVDKEVRKGAPLTFQLYSISIDQDFPCFELKRELYIDDIKIEIPSDTGEFKNSIQLQIPTSELAAGDHMMKIRVSGCGDLETEKTYKFAIVEGLPPVAKIVNTKLIAEGGKHDKLQLLVHFSSDGRPVKSIILKSIGLGGTADDRVLDSLQNINKTEGDTSFFVYVKSWEQYSFVLTTSDNISTLNTDTFNYKFEYSVIEDSVISSNSTWEHSKSPYLISGKLEIKGGTLQIGAGVIVRIGIAGQILVHDDENSSIIVEGTSSNPVNIMRQYVRSKGMEINQNSSFKYCNIDLGSKMLAKNTSIALENCKLDSIALDPNSNFSSCFGNTINYLSIYANQVNTVGENNTISKQDIISKK